MGKKNNNGETNMKEILEKADDMRTQLRNSLRDVNSNNINAVIQSAPTDLLQKELNRREKKIGKMINHRKRVLMQIAKIEFEIRESGMPIPDNIDSRNHPCAGKTMLKNEILLPDLLISILKENDKPMSIGELTDQAIKHGYKTRSSKFSRVVSQALLTNRKKFRRVDKGVYSTK